MSTLPKLTEHEAIVYAYLLHHKANAHEIERSFKEGKASGAWRGVATLQHENHVSRYLKSLEGKGLIKAVPQSEMKEELLRQNPPAKRRWGRPRNDAPKRTLKEKHLGKYYAADPTFFVRLLASSTNATEEEAQAFLHAIEKFSRPPAEVVKTLDAISNPDIITALGYLRLLAEELANYFRLESSIHTIKGHVAQIQEGIKRDQQIIVSRIQGYREFYDAKMRKEPQKLRYVINSRGTHFSSVPLHNEFIKNKRIQIAQAVNDVADERAKQHRIVSMWKYLHPSKGEEAIGKGDPAPEQVKSIFGFGYAYAGFHDTELMWRLQEEKGLSRPAPFPA